MSLENKKALQSQTVKENRVPCGIASSADLRRSFRVNHRLRREMDANELKEGLKIRGEIERVNGKELSYTDFVQRYPAKNQPVVLTGLMDDCKDWVDCNGKPNLGFFSYQFGNSQVQEYSEYKAYETSLFYDDDWLNL